MSPRATVAISFHDEERHLGAAVRSVLNQTFADFELLLFDDGSSDRSIDVARTFLDDPRVRVFPSRERRYLGARLNEALGVARGELFARMDADDVMHPSRLALQVAHLDRSPRCDAVGSWAALVGDDEAPFGVIEGVAAPASGRQLVERGLIAHATMVARAPWLRSYPYDASLTRAEDRDLWCRIGRTSRVDVVEQVLYVVRVLPDSPGFLDDYARGQSDLRRVVLRHGPRLVGMRRTARLLGASMLKQGVMTAAQHLRASSRLVLRRGRPPRPEERRRIDEALASARQAP
ncbi:MAG: glycosyltransferase family 2 protein [Labilithrix sp.]|nr:glycosyltransferase family 2 protein [Labilithrix sp.]